MMIAQFLPTIFDIYIIFKKQLLRGVSIGSGLNRDILSSEFVRFSKDLFLLQIIGIFAFQFDTFIVGTILAPAMVSVLTVVSKPMLIARMVNNQTLLVFGPLFAQRSRKGKDSQVFEILYRGNLVMSILMLPIVTLMIILIQPFVDLYIGGEYSRYAYWGQVAALIFLFSPFCGLVQKLMVYTDQVRQVRNISFWLVLVNFATSIAGTFFWGIGGVIVGSLVQSALAVPTYNWLFFRHRQVGIWEVYSPLALINLLYISVTGFVMFWIINSSDISTWWQFIFAGAVSTGLLYALGLAIIVHKRLWVAPKG